MRGGSSVLALAEGSRSNDVQILRLRSKIETDAAKPRYILTERGAGYLFGVPVETVY